MKFLGLVAAAALIALPAFAAPVRPDADTARDGVRKPADMVAFAGIKPGSKVLDIIAGGGYFTRVFAIAVMPGGHVTAVVPSASAQMDPVGAKAMTDLAADASYGNVSIVGAVTDPSLAGSIDVAWTAQNYHDLHNFLPPEGVIGFNKAVFAALKPGGTYIVLDHAAADGSGLTATKALHRIDAAAVKAEVIAAGFVFDGESSAVRNPADTRDKMVFDPGIRGKTDQFVLRFKKP